MKTSLSSYLKTKIKFSLYIIGGKTKENFSRENEKETYLPFTQLIKFKIYESEGKSGEFYSDSLKDNFISHISQTENSSENSESGSNFMSSGGSQMENFKDESSINRIETRSAQISKSFIHSINLTKSTDNMLKEMNKSVKKEISCTQNSKSLPLYLFFLFK